MVCTASVQLIQMLLERGELKESDLEDDVKEQVTEDEIIEQRLDAYEDVVLDPTRESTSFAAEGTVLHEVRADCLFFGMEPYEFVGKTLSADGFSFEIDSDMADRLVPGIDWIRELSNNPHVEERVPLDPWLPEQYGFCDTFWVTGDTLYVSDYKNGVGEPVYAEGNRQLRLYALGAWTKLGQPPIERVMLNIDQPRSGGMKEWLITLEELLEFGAEVRRVYDRIESGNVEFVPTRKGCRWCPVRKTKRGCAAFNTWHLMMIGAAILDPSANTPAFQDPSQMPRALRYYIVSHGAQIKQWLAKLHEESLAAAIEGDPDPGSKAIEGGEGRRFFPDESAAAAVIESAIGEDAYTKKLIGFTEIEKVMKPGRKKKGFPLQYAELLELIDRRESKPKLVSADHPKPAYVRCLEDEFEDQTEDDFEDEL